MNKNDEHIFNLVMYIKHNVIFKNINERKCTHKVLLFFDCVLMLVQCSSIIVDNEVIQLA